MDEDTKKSLAKMNQSLDSISKSLEEVQNILRGLRKDKEGGVIFNQGPPPSGSGLSEVDCPVCAGVGETYDSPPRSAVRIECYKCWGKGKVTVPTSG